MDTLLPTILSNTYTKADVYRRFALMREFSEFVVYRKEAEAERPLLDELRDFLVERKEDERHIEALRTWGESFWGDLISGNLSRRLDQLYKELTDLPIIVFYIPSELRADYIDSAGAWLRKETKKDVLLDVRISHRVAGGCAFSLNGRFYDYSFAARVSDYHDQVLALVRESAV